jgi:hypothetical protein
MAGSRPAPARWTESYVKRKAVSVTFAGSAPRVEDLARRRAPADARARPPWLSRLSGSVSTHWQPWALIDQRGGAPPWLAASASSPSRP